MSWCMVLFIIFLQYFRTSSAKRYSAYKYHLFLCIYCYETWLFVWYDNYVINDFHCVWYIHTDKWKTNPTKITSNLCAKRSTLKLLNSKTSPIRPKIKYRLFPLSDRPTKIAATQKILLPHLRKKYFSTWFHSYHTWTR
jgi:hypothetical protein